MANGYAQQDAPLQFGNQHYYLKWMTPNNMKKQVGKHEKLELGIILLNNVNNEIEKFIKPKVTLFKNAYKYNALERRERGDINWNELILGRYQVEIVIINKKMLGVKYTFQDDIFNKLSSKSPAAMELAKTLLKDRPSAEDFLDKLRRKTKTIQLVSDDDFENHITNLLSTAKIMNKKS